MYFNKVFLQNYYYIGIKYKKENACYLKGVNI